MLIVYPLSGDHPRVYARALGTTGRTAGRPSRGPSTWPLAGPTASCLFQPNNRSQVMPKSVARPHKRGRGVGRGGSERLEVTTMAGRDWVGSANTSPPRSSSAPGSRPGYPSSGTCSEAARRPRSAGSWPPSLASPPSTWRQRVGGDDGGTTRCHGVRRAHQRGNRPPEHRPDSLYQVAEVFFA